MDPTTTNHAPPGHHPLAPHLLTAADVTLPLMTSPSPFIYAPPANLPSPHHFYATEKKPSSPSSSSSSSSSGGGMKAAVEETPVVVIGRRGCCMGHVVKRLLEGLGVSPAVWEIAGDAAEEAALKAEIGEMGPTGAGYTVTLPVVFIGGKLVGGLDHLMAAHITGELVPNLKEAGALWL